MDRDSDPGQDDHPVAYVDRTLEPLIPRFLQRRRDDAEAIETLAAAGDFGTIQSMGHSMRGSGGGYGFDPITDFGARIEAAAIRCDGPSVIAEARKMRAYLEVVEVELLDE